MSSGIFRVRTGYGYTEGVAVGFFTRDPMTQPSRKSTPSKWDIIEPVGKRVVIRKDDNRRETKSGIVLPGNHEIPTLTGRVIAISKQIERDEDFPIRKLDKVMFDPREAIPVEFEPDNRLFVVPLERVLAIFRRPEDVDESEGGGTGE
jgi:chaperonin GroES